MKKNHAFHGIFAGGRRSAAALTVVCAVAVSGCSSNKTSSASPPPVQAAPQPPAPNLMQIHADEDGQIPVLAFGDVVSGSSASAGNVTVEQFKKDLDWLYSHDYRPIGLQDLAAGKIDVPAGKSPVVLTFDGSTPGQFRTLPDGSTDPNCAVAILEAFNNQHQDWALKGGFMIPAARGTAKSEFDGNAVAYKLEHLNGDGFDVGCALPPTLGKMTSDQVVATIGEGVSGIASVGVGTPQVLEVPEGAYPANISLLHAGSRMVPIKAPAKREKNMAAAAAEAMREHPISYTNVCAVTGGNSPSLSPADKKFDPFRIPRIAVDGAHPVEVALKSVTERFVSDGDPTTIAVPQAKANDVNAPMLQQNGITVKPYPGAVASAH